MRRERQWSGAGRAYVWDRCLLFQAASFVVDRRQRPYRRLAATVIVASRRRFVLEVNGRPPREYQGVIIAPNVLRRYIEAVESDLTFVDAGITSVAYRDLEPHLAKGDVRPLTADELAAVEGPLAAAFASELDCEAAIELFGRVVRAICPERRASVERDARVERVMELVDRLPLHGLSVSMLAREVGLSDSRLRDLFRKSLGCRLSQYMRWVAAWKAVSLWQEGMKFTDVAHAVGFHDLAHADHAISEIFGLSPSEMTDPRRVVFHKCGP